MFKLKLEKIQLEKKVIDRKEKELKDRLTIAESKRDINNKW